MAINYVSGDATAPFGTDPRIIVHVCNDVGAWGRGFVLAVSRKWPQPEQQYRAWYQNNQPLPFALGQVLFVSVEQHVWVANLIGQHGIRLRRGVPPVRYDAIRQGLQHIATFAQQTLASIHMPRIGAGLAGGDWQMISQIIEEELIEKDLTVTVYDLPS